MKPEFFEGIKTFCTNVYLYISGAVWGKVTVYYNEYTDCVEITIKNRFFNCEPFHMTYPEFSKEMRHGISSGLIGNFVLSEYRSYLDNYIYKKG